MRAKHLVLTYFWRTEHGNGSKTVPGHRSSSRGSSIKVSFSLLAVLSAVSYIINYSRYWLFKSIKLLASLKNILFINLYWISVYYGVGWCILCSIKSLLSWWYWFVATKSVLYLFDLCNKYYFLGHYLKYRTLPYRHGHMNRKPNQKIKSKTELMFENNRAVPIYLELNNRNRTNGYMNIPNKIYIPQSIIYI